MIVPVSMKSNFRVKHLFPELPPTPATNEVGGRSAQQGMWLEFGARWLLRVFGDVVTAAARHVGRPLLRLPVMELTLILIVFAVLSLSLV